MKTSSIAIDYAKVFYDVCEERNIVDEVLYDIKALIKMSEENLDQLFSIPIITRKMKKELLDELTKANIHAEVINLLKVLVDNDEFKIFNEILAEYQNIYQEKRNIKIVHITTARKLSSNAIDNIRVQLEAKFNSYVVIMTTINPEIIGGIKIEYSGKEIDNTILNQLNKLKKQFN